MKFCGFGDHGNMVQSYLPNPTTLDTAKNEVHN